MPESSESQLLNSVGAFIARFGATTLITVIFLWYVWDDRQRGISVMSEQLKNMNGQLLHVSDKLLLHSDGSEKNDREVLRVLTATCINQATNAEQRERCLGWR